MCDSKINILRALFPLILGMSDLCVINIVVTKQILVITDNNDVVTNSLSPHHIILNNNNTFDPDTNTAIINADVLTLISHLTQS